MKVKVSYPMLKLIKEILPAYKVELIKMTPDNYFMLVDYDLYRNESDYSDKTGKYSTIKVSYPPEYYAQPRYITTLDMTKIFRSSDKTLTGYKQGIIDFCTI